MKPSDITLIKTCDACPEQYDAYNAITNEKIGYLRLRGGCFTVQNANEEIIISAYPLGDGMFTSDEREGYLNMAKEYLAIDYENSQHKPVGEFSEE